MSRIDADYLWAFHAEELLKAMPKSVRSQVMGKRSPEVRAEVVRLRLEGYTYQQIACMTGSTYEGVRTCLRRLAKRGAETSRKEVATMPVMSGVWRS